jgi:small subunit ribosomal protein S19
MTRSLKKGVFSEVTITPNEIVKVWSRGSMILPIHVNNEVHVHTGKTFHKVKITQEMIGHKFGEFARTRKQAIHKKAKVIRKKK